MNGRIGLAEALLGLEGFRVLAVVESPDELVVRVETTATVAWCTACGVRAEPQAPQHPKSALQEWAAAHRRKPPAYEDRKSVV